MTYLCVPLTADTCPEMARRIEAAGNGSADMVELRLDYLREWDSEAIGNLMAKAKQFSGQVVATCRLVEEGGRFDQDEAQRIRLMELVGRSGADFIDIEYAAWQQSSKLREKIGSICGLTKTAAKKMPGKDLKSCQLILSKHDFQRTPVNLDALFADLSREPCHVVKVACMAETIVDSLRMLEALRDSAAKRPTIALSMGETGVLTRVLAKKFGALLIFASLEAGKESAPGQLTLPETRSVYRWDKLSSATPVYGVIGYPVAHSMSPAIHNAAFEAIGYDGVYLPMHVEPDFESFKAFLDGCLDRPWLDLRGCSVTIPHKKSLLQYVEQRSGQIEPLARRIGVANTLCIAPNNGQGNTGLVLSAYNTDYCGALDALCEGMGISRSDLSKLSVAVLGAGGVSRAIVAGLRDCGCKVTIYNRTQSKAETLAAEFGANALPVEQRSKHNADVVINCTSIGMWPHIGQTPLPAEGLKHRPAVFDTVYNPIETRLLREAREHGCKTIDGVAMFIKQAVAQFERWTGRHAPAEVMRNIVINRLSQ